LPELPGYFTLTRTAMNLEKELVPPSIRHLADKSVAQQKISNFMDSR
jgi:hypothetical protein